MPEFLREATAQWDALNPSFILIGCNDQDDGARLAELFAPLLVQVIQVAPPVVEMVKLSLNAYLHTLISFWNEVHLICEQIRVSSHLVGKLAAQDPRVVPYGATMHGRPVGGGCLPKDLTQLIDFAAALGETPDLLQAVQRVNDKLSDAASHARNGHDASESATGHANGYRELLPRSGVVHLRW
jgi:UDPglucose 6-dehydrogenase